MTLRNLIGAGEMSPQLKVLAALTGELSQPSVTAVPGDLMTSSALCVCQPCIQSTYIHAGKHSHTHEIK